MGSRVEKIAPVAFGLFLAVIIGIVYSDFKLMLVIMGIIFLFAILPMILKRNR